MSQELSDTLQRIDNTITKFNPLSPSSLETRKNRIFNLVSKGVYRLYGMDHVNISKVKSLMSPHEEVKSNLPSHMNQIRTT